jgi:hypothetical protein
MGLSVKLVVTVLKGLATGELILVALFSTKGPWPVMRCIQTLAIILMGITLIRRWQKTHVFCQLLHN